ncbi:unnamed protein product [Toxocara canis]|uniref:Transcription initiation factor TFIID subunit 1 n=1 Tax=Toxocara canis TaxID=6265 RepID=A0A183V9M1_TOXCA|nr:unnamed protein product [Toxocara canis]
MYWSKGFFPQKFGDAFEEDHPTDPNGRHVKEASNSHSEMDISVAESSGEPSQKQEQIQESSISFQPVVEDPTLKEVDEPSLVRHIGGTAYETPVKTATTK